MYNLFVAAKSEAWNGEPWMIELNRCVREYTSEEIQEKYGGLGERRSGNLAISPVFSPTSQEIISIRILARLLM